MPIRKYSLAIFGVLISPIIQATNSMPKGLVVCIKNKIKENIYNVNAYFIESNIWDW